VQRSPNCTVRLSAQAFLSPQPFDAVEARQGAVTATEPLGRVPACGASSSRETSDGGAARARMRRVLGWWAFGTAAWLVLSATLARPDVVAAVAAGAVVAGSVELGHRAGLVDFRLRWRWLVHLPRLPLQVAHDLPLLARVLIRPTSASSAFRALPFDVGGDDPTAVGRRALLTLAASLGPNTFIAGYDRDRGVVLVHQLVVNEQVLPLPDGRYPSP